MVVTIPPGSACVFGGLTPSVSDVMVWLKKINGVDVTYGGTTYAVWSYCWGGSQLSAGALVPTTVPASCRIVTTYNLNWGPAICYIN